jgi:NADPH:quinone reductase-like Zn-dependent oxidoreductase
VAVLYRYAQLLDLTDRVAVIGATSGIGRSLAVGLADMAPTSYPGTAHRSGEAACREVAAAEDRRSGEPMLTERTSIDLARPVSTLRRVDILVNAAE